LEEKGKKNKKKKGKPLFLQPFLQYAVKNLNEYNSQFSMGNKPDWRIKEALMYSIGSIRDEILDQKELKNEQLEQMLATFILPELQSPIAALRLRAC